MNPQGDRSPRMFSLPRVLATAALLAPVLASQVASAHSRRSAAAPQQITATISPSPFIPVHATARIVASAIGAGGQAASLSSIRVKLLSTHTGIKLSRPTAAERSQGVVALITAGNKPVSASVAVSARGSGAPQKLPLRTYSSPSQLVAGKGAWASWNTLSSLGYRTILQRIAQEHITHLYLETSGNRFIGQPQLNALLQTAHNMGIAVIAWQYTSLLNPGMQATAAQMTLGFQTAMGAQVDGLAADFEQNLGVGAMQTYSAAVRQAAGPSRVYVGVIYPPQYGFHTPIGTMARYVDVIAPMDYWMGAPRAYTAAEAASFITNSINELRSTPGENNLPIEVVSQTQNVENSSGFGLYNPPVSQVLASARAAMADGAIGVSFYDLRTQTQAQIAAIASLNLH